eukprot:scaffold152584_cov43-Prasinocladus_malaysianus.AAC.1
MQNSHISSKGSTVQSRHRVPVTVARRYDLEVNMSILTSAPSISQSLNRPRIYLKNWPRRGGSQRMLPNLTTTHGCYLERVFRWISVTYLVQQEVKDLRSLG